MAFYQHSDEVIEAARVLQDELMKDSPFGNEDMARDWMHQNFYEVVLIARQKTEAEEKFAGVGKL